MTWCAWRDGLKLIRGEGTEAGENIYRLVRTLGMVAAQGGRFADPDEIAVHRVDTKLQWNVSGS